MYELGIPGTHIVIPQREARDEICVPKITSTSLAMRAPGWP